MRAKGLAPETVRQTLRQTMRQTVRQTLRQTLRQTIHRTAHRTAHETDCSPVAPRAQDSMLRRGPVITPTTMATTLVEGSPVAIAASLTSSLPVVPVDIRLMEVTSVRASFLGVPSIRAHLVRGALVEHPLITPLTRLPR